MKMNHFLLLFAAAFTISTNHGSSLDSMATDPCFVQGECINSFSIDISRSGDEFECHEFCQADERCSWFTFLPDLLACSLSDNCITLDVEVCPNCLSGEKSCQPAEPKCFIQGECEGTVLAIGEAVSIEACLESCKVQKGCKWFTYLLSSKACFMFSNCDSFDEVSQECISGERRCKIEVETTTLATTSTTTTELQPSGYSKVLIGHGWNDNFTIASVEVFDLLSPEKKCQNLPDLPYKNDRSAGILLNGEKPLVCGGAYNDKTSCFLFDSGVWESASSLNEARCCAVLVTSPFHGDGSQVFITGGLYNTTSLYSSEVLTQSGWQMSISLPIDVHYHCMISINSTSVMIIGGIQNNQTSGRTHIFNSETNIWTQGPTMSEARHLHSCAFVRKNGQSEEKSIISVAGETGDFISSRVVEILDAGSNGWRRGPDLPIKLHGAAIVEDPFGGVVLIGGYSVNPYHFFDTFYKLAHAGPDARWEEMPQKLKTERHLHFAILVPDNITDCK